MAGKTKAPLPPPNPNNVLLSGVIIFVLFLVGVWIFATPAHPISSSPTQLSHGGEVTNGDKEEGDVATRVTGSHSTESSTDSDHLKSGSKADSDSDAEGEAKSDSSKDKDSGADSTESTTGEAEAGTKERLAGKESQVEGVELASETDQTQGLEDQASESEAEKEQTSTPSGEKFVLPLCDLPDDNIPCLDNAKAIKALKSKSHFQHRERHCPEKGEYPRCLLPLPDGYKVHVNWPESRDQIWYNNVPKPSLANYKADQNWVKAEGDKFIFPGGGTQFKFGATKYIEWVQDTCPELAWGKHVRVALDMGCGVASFGAYLDAFDVRVMSVAPKDEHDSQIQFALERGVSALVGVMGTMRQPYPANVYDAIHCARCRVPWYREGGVLLLELNRLIRPGGYFIWSATPLCFDCKASEPDDHEVWEAMKDLTEKMCWKQVVKKVDKKWGIGVLVWQKPTDNTCYDNREEGTQPPMCAQDDNADAAWYIPMQACLHRVPTSSQEHGGEWPAEGRNRLTAPPNWLKSMQKGVYGAPAYDEFQSDTEHWERVAKTYLNNVGIVWENVRNVMDMDSHYGGFGAAISGRPLWSMNVVPTTSPDTLSIVFDRGLLGIYHDWCESFNTYPRTYDLLHADHVLGHQAKDGKCEILDVMQEMDRILRPMGYVIVREHKPFSEEIKAIAKGLHWEVLKQYEEGTEALLVYQKTLWRPSS